MKSIAIEKVLAKIKSLRLLRGLIQFTLLLTAAILLYFLTIQVADRYLFYHPVPVWLLAGAGMLFLAAGIILRTKAETKNKIARELDQRYNLKERIGTYVELSGSDHSFLPALASETEKYLKEIPILKSAHFARGSLTPLCITAGLLVCLLTIPFWPVPASIASRAEQQKNIQYQAKELRKKIESIRKEELHSPELKKLAADFLKTAKQLEKPGKEPVEAMKNLNALQDQWKQAQKSMDESLRTSLSKQLGELAKQSGSTKSGGETDGSLSEAARELQKDLAKEGLEGGEQIEEALRNGTLSKEQLQKMKKSLEEYRKQKQDQEKKLAELQESLQNAQEGLQSGKAKVVYNSKLKNGEGSKGKGGVEDGPGTTNEDIGPKHFSTKKEGKGEYKEDRTKAEYEQLYSGQREDVGKDPLFIGSQWDPEKSKYVRIRSFGQDSDPTISSDGQGLGGQTTEESVVTKERVPAAYREMIRKYFESIGQ
jgi:hypothetical protein